MINFTKEEINMLITILQDDDVFEAIGQIPGLDGERVEATYEKYNDIIEKLENEKNT